MITILVIIISGWVTSQILTDLCERISWLGSILGTLWVQKILVIVMFLVFFYGNPRHLGVFGGILYVGMVQWRNFLQDLHS